MERRRTGVTDGTDTEGERQPSGREQQAEDTEQDSFLREVRAAISSARANEGIADKEREAREAEQVDLIEKENEKLKERDRQRENELSEIRRKSEEEITAVKEDYEEKNNDLIRQKEKYKSSKAELDIKIKEQDDIIVEVPPACLISTKLHWKRNIRQESKSPMLNTKQ